jgi:hypothetical protein
VDDVWVLYPQQNEGVILGTTSLHRNPSISSAQEIQELPQRKLYVTFDNTDDVFMRPFANGGFGSLETVPASVGPPSYNSQVSADTRDGDTPNIYVVWEAVGIPKGQGPLNGVDTPPQQSKVIYQAKVGSTWNPTAHEFKSINPGIHYYRPTITNLQSGNLVWAWDDGSNTYFATYDGADWMIDDRAYPGSYANVALGGTIEPLSYAEYVSMYGSVPPYRLQLSQEISLSLSQRSDGPQRNGLRQLYSRRAEVAEISTPEGRSSERGDTSAYLAVELSKIILKMNDGSSTPVEFITINDTLPGGNEDTVWKQLSTV